jgi:hypothetical protein
MVIKNYWCDIKSKKIKNKHVLILIIFEKCETKVGKCEN